MAEYIEREAVTCRDCYHWGVCDGFGFVLDPIHGGVICDSFVKAADVVEVVHGRWVVENEESIRCSECCFNRASIKIPLDYCPNCGARMDGED